MLCYVGDIVLSLINQGVRSIIIIMELFYRVQKILLYIIFVLAIVLLFNAIVEQYAIGIVMIFTGITVGAGWCITAIKREHDE